MAGLRFDDRNKYYLKLEYYKFFYIYTNVFFINKILFKFIFLIYIIFFLF